VTTRLRDPLTPEEWANQLVAYDFPLRPNMLIRIILPARLTPVEAGRIANIVRALAMDEVAA
jgi:hypothetical protein